MTRTPAYTSHADMDWLAEQVRNVPTEFRTHFAAQVMTLGLMRTNRWLCWMVKTLAKFRKISEHHIWEGMFQRLPSMTNDTINALADHIRIGHDTTDPASAGGLNKDEVDILLKLLNENR